MTPPVKWARVLVFGLLTGVVWTLLSAVVLATVGAGFMAALPERSTRVQLFLLGANMLGGVWVLWLYASIRAAHAGAWRATLAAGTGWWVIQSLQSAKWVALGAVPVDVVWGAALGTLPAMVLASAAGAWCYENFVFSLRRPVTRPAALPSAEPQDRGGPQQ